MSLIAAVQLLAACLLFRRIPPNLALRHDTPELLYYGAHVAPMYQGWFDQMAAQSDQ